MAKLWTPHPYQLQASKFLLERGVGALWLSPGLGKTSVSLSAIKALKEMNQGTGNLVIAPLHVCYNSWPDEIRKWEQFRKLKYVILHGPGKKEALNLKADIYLINPEGLQWLFNELTNREWPFDKLWVDESSKFKHAQTQRFKLLRHYLNRFRRRYELTGSPAPNGLMDVWAQIYLLDQGNALGRFITHYRTNYFNQAGYGGYTYVLKQGADKEIHKRLRPLVLRMDEKDWLQLPPLTFNNVKVQLPDKAFQKYRTMENQLLAFLDDGTATAANAAVAGNKLLQMANGAVYLDEDYNRDSKLRKWGHLHDTKIEALVDLVDEQAGEPLLVAYWFDHDRQRLEKIFNAAPFIGGGTSPKQAAEIIDMWNHGRVPLLFVHPLSAAHGLNLQGTHASVCFFSMLWDLEAYDQLIRRVWRQGQEQRVVVHRIIAENTIDEAVCNALAAKGRVQDRLMAALKERRARTK